MGYTNKNAADAQDFGLAVDRSAHLDDITVNFVRIRETHSLKDALAGLPEKMENQSPLPPPLACPMMLDELLAEP